MSLSTLLLLGAAGAALGAPVPQEPMVVTASRVQQPLDETLASVSLITRTDIERSQARGLLELLRLQTGVDVARTGGPGQQTSLFLRGTESNHVLVLVDGIRVNAPQNGAFTWENLPLAQIERIEIVRGPHAAFYGSDAVGGVIQIFTRSPDGVALGARAGSYGTRQASAAVGGGDAARWRLSADWQDTEGFSAQKPGGFSFDPDDDGFENTSVSGGVTLAPGDWGNLSFSGLHSDATVEFDPGASDTETTTLGMGWQRENLTLRLGYFQEQRATPVFDSGFDAERLSLDWQLNEAVAGGRWTVGLNYRHEDGRSYSLATGATAFGDRRDNTGLFSGLRLPFGQWQTELTLRHDENSEFGGHTTGQAAIARSLGTGTRLRASAGTAFRGPNLNEQFSPGFGGQFAGNPDLDPETSRSYELGVEHVITAGHRLEASLYHTDVDDLIAFAGENFRAINIRKAGIDGFEASYAWRSGDWQADAGLTLQDTEDESTGRSLLRRADEKYNVTLDRLFANGGNLGLEVMHHGERRDISNTLDAYTLLNLRLRWPLGEAWALEGRAENLLDEDYELAAGFNTAGASAYVGVSWRP